MTPTVIPATNNEVAIGRHANGRSSILWFVDGDRKIYQRRRRGVPADVAEAMVRGVR